jgi:hypothetical protein
MGAWLRHLDGLHQPHVACFMGDRIRGQLHPSLRRERAYREKVRRLVSVSKRAMVQDHGEVGRVVEEKVGGSRPGPEEAVGQRLYI